MRRVGFRRFGFTLIELLVVIAIIALLLAIIMPSLKKAKDAAKRAVCLAHLHSLGISWVTYADENDGRIISSKTARVDEISSNPRQFNWRLFNDYHTGPSWVGWFEETWDTDLEEYVVDEEGRKACVELGSMYPYNETLGIYRCPVGIKNELRTYAIVDSMNGHVHDKPAGMATRHVFKKMSEVPSASSRLVFIDEGWATTESWTINPYVVEWWDGVPLRHGDGTTVAMADGSAEYWKWKEQKTIDFANGDDDNISTAINNVDFDKIQRAAWGKLAQ